jgi:hypothetical protein
VVKSDHASTRVATTRSGGVAGAYARRDSSDAGIFAWPGRDGAIVEAGAFLNVRKIHVGKCLIVWPGILA